MSSNTPKSLHILGICGTFMGGIALLARALGYQVSGADAQVYPPMSTQLESAGIMLHEGYDAEQLAAAPDQVIVGNAMTRGLPVIEALLDRGQPYVSGPQWLAEQLLSQRHVLAVAGTHGKTTTASLLAWILDQAGLDPGFLIGGVPNDFNCSARLGSGRYFVVEADEYDTAFFDKRSKFVHYRPRTLILNNLEFDHADIFDDLAMIQRQFHHLVRTIPSTGCILYPQQDAALNGVLAQGCWTPTQTLALDDDTADWSIKPLARNGGQFQLTHRGIIQGEVRWTQTGNHNLYNALSAIAAAAQIGVSPQQALDAVARFGGVRRRMEKRGEVAGISVYDDFAHHPTAIATTIEGLRNTIRSDQRIFAVLEPRSNTMRLGGHAAALTAALATADQVLVFAPPTLNWNAAETLAWLGERLRVATAVAELITYLVAHTKSGDQVLIMSNGGFENIHQRLLTQLSAHHAT